MFFFRTKYKLFWCKYETNYRFSRLLRNRKAALLYVMLTNGFIQHYCLWFLLKATLYTVIKYSINRMIVRTLNVSLLLFKMNLLINVVNPQYKTCSVPVRQWTYSKHPTTHRITHSYRCWCSAYYVLTTISLPNVLAEIHSTESHRRKMPFYLFRISLDESLEILLLNGRWVSKPLEEETLTLNNVREAKFGVSYHKYDQLSTRSNKIQTELLSMNRPCHIIFISGNFKTYTF